MKNKILWSFVAIVVCIGCIGGLFLYYQYDTKHLEVAYINEAPVAQIPSATKDNWLDNAKNFTKSYAYPAQEFDIFVDFMDPNSKPISQRILIAAVNDYFFSCLNEYFKQENIDFAYSKNNNSVDLIVYLPKQYAKAQNLIDELNYFDIPYIYQ